ncbi:MAG TPA: hypothetical protein VFQ20_01075 [Burkholderiaceae bacterium]|nr:hypothetical protein [Burkholderiaceae bacterium]
MSQRIRFILGCGAVVATAAGALPVASKSVAATPTASARRSAAQPKARTGVKRPRVK